MNEEVAKSCCLKEIQQRMIKRRLVWFGQNKYGVFRMVEEIEDDDAAFAIVQNFIPSQFAKHTISAA